MSNPMTYDVVPDALAQQTKSNTSNRTWVAVLEQGKMLRVSKRPQWLPNDRARSGQKMKSRAVGDGTTDVYIWLIEDPDAHKPESTEAEVVSALRR